MSFGRVFETIFPPPEWPYRTPAEEGYQHDAEYHALVDLLEAQIHAGRFSPAELRQAVVLAAIHYEMRRSNYTVVRMEPPEEPK